MKFYGKSLRVEIEETEEDEWGWDGWERLFTIVIIRRKNNKSVTPCKDV